MNILLSILVALCAAELNDFVTYSTPDEGYNINALSRYFPKILDITAPNTAIIRGEKRLFYLRFLREDGSQGVSKVYSTAFFPAVDDYTILNVPNSYDLLDNYASSQIKTNISVVMYYGNTYFQTSWRPWTKFEFGTTYHVSGRTVLVKANKGVVTSFDWAPTGCILSSCTCIDHICGETCPSKSCDITVRVAWTGTDASGAPLNSYNRDIYRLKNTFQ